MAVLHRAQADHGLVLAVDVPLQTRERADHDDTRGQTLGEQVHGAHLRRQLAEGLALVDRVAHHGHQVVHGLRGDGAEDTSPVTGRERDHQLLGHGHLGLLHAEALLQLLVDPLSGDVEAHELDHRVRHCGQATASQEPSHNTARESYHTEVRPQTNTAAFHTCTYSTRKPREKTQPNTATNPKPCNSARWAHATPRPPPTRQATSTVRTLAAPQRLQRAERELGLRLVLAHLAHRGQHALGQRRGVTRQVHLHLHLGHLEGAQRDVREHLGRAGRSSPHRHLVALALQRVLADDAGVQILEELVQAELEHALRAVAEERGDPALDQTSRALLSHDLLQTRDQTARPAPRLGVRLHVSVRACRE